MPALFVLLLLLLVGPALNAQPAADLFRITDIAVDESANTAAQARAQALAQVRQDAFARLVRRLASEADTARLPDMSDAQLQRLIQGLQVQDEAFSDTRYVATYSVQFRPDAVRRVFREADIVYSEAVATPHLVVPVLDRGGALMLWQQDNPWAAALNSPLARDRLIPYRFAEGDREDARLLPAGRAAAGDAAALADFAAHHAVEAVLVVQARLRFDPRLRRDTLHYSYRIWPRGGAGEGRLVAEPEQDRAGLFAEAADRIYTRLNERQAERTRVQGGSGGTLMFDVPVASLDEFVTIQKRLHSVSLIQSVRLVRVGLPVSRFEVSFLGGADQLALALADVGVQVDQGPQGHALSLIEGAAAGRP